MISLLGGIVFGGGLAFVGWLSVLAWRFVFVPDHGDCPSGTAATREPNPQAVSALRASVSYRGARG